MTSRTNQMGRKRNKKRSKSKSKADKERIREVLRRQEEIMKKGSTSDISKALISSKNLYVNLGKRLKKQRSKSKELVPEKRFEGNQAEDTQNPKDSQEIKTSQNRILNTRFGQITENTETEISKFKRKIKSSSLHQDVNDNQQNTLKRVKTDETPNPEAKVPKVNLFAVKKFKVEEEEQKRIQKETEIPVQPQSKEIIPNLSELDLKSNPFNRQNEEFLEDRNHIIKGMGFDESEESKDAHLKKFILFKDKTVTEISKIRESLGFSTKKVFSYTKTGEKITPLPIDEFEHSIVQSVRENLVTFICGATGSGKSTRIPQILYDHGLINRNSRLAVTQPRRIAAISLSKRVTEEMGVTYQTNKDEVRVGYQVRWDKSRNCDKAVVKFLTDGILLNEMMSDRALSQYDVIVIDEAHERKMVSDVLVGLLSKTDHKKQLTSVRIRAKHILKNLRKANNLSEAEKIARPLRLIIMSATLNIEELKSNKKLFPQKINVVNIPAKTYPVHVYYNKQTPEEVLENVAEKVEKIHRCLPKGGVLVFLPGRRSILELKELLERNLRGLRCRAYDEDPKNAGTQKELENNAPQAIEEEKPENEEDIDNFDLEDPDLFGSDPLETWERQVQSSKEPTFRVLPLYSKMDASLQDRIFKTSQNIRTIVLATNVAETSLTIPNLKYVIDTGLEKVRRMDEYTKATVFNIQYISKASARQRAGRVGRTSVGHCYRIYAPGLFAKLEDFRAPEIVNTSINHLILQLIRVGVRELFHFPFITPPPIDKMRRAVLHLAEIGALEVQKKEPLQPNSQEKLVFSLTQLGEALSHIPLEPVFSKMLLTGRQRGVVLNIIFLLNSLISEDYINLEKLKSEFKHMIAEENHSSPGGLSKKKKSGGPSAFKTYLLTKYEQFINTDSDLFSKMGILKKLTGYVIRIMVNEKDTFWQRKLNQNFNKNGSFEDKSNILEDLENDLDFDTSKVKIEEKDFMNFTDELVQRIHDKGSSVYHLILQFCIKWSLNRKLISEGLKFVFQMSKLILSIENSNSAKQNFLNKFTLLINNHKINKSKSPILSEILCQHFHERILFKKLLQIDQKREWKFFDEENSEVSVLRSSFVKRQTSFYIYSGKLLSQDKLWVSGLTKIRDISLLLKHSPQYTHIKLDLEGFSKRYSNFSHHQRSHTNSKHNHFLAEIKLPVEAEFGRARWTADRLWLTMDELREIRNKNENFRGQIKLLRGLKRLIEASGYKSNQTTSANTSNPENRAIWKGNRLISQIKEDPEIDSPKSDIEMENQSKDDDQPNEFKEISWLDSRLEAIKRANQSEKELKEALAIISSFVLLKGIWHSKVKVLENKWNFNFEKLDISQMKTNPAILSLSLYFQNLEIFNKIDFEKKNIVQNVEFKNKILALIKKKFRKKVLELFEKIFKD